MTTAVAPRSPVPAEPPRLRRSRRWIVLLAVAVAVISWVVWWVLFRSVVEHGDPVVYFDAEVESWMGAGVDCDNAVPRMEFVTEPRPFICWDSNAELFVVYLATPGSPAWGMRPLSEDDPCVRWTESTNAYIRDHDWMRLAADVDQVRREQCQPFTTVGGVQLVLEWWYRIEMPDDRIVAAVFVAIEDGAAGFGVGERTLFAVSPERLGAGAVELIDRDERLGLLLATLQPGVEYQVVKWRLARFHGMDGALVEFDVKRPARPVTAVFVEPWFAEPLDDEPSGVVFEAEGRRFYLNYDEVDQIAVLPLGA